MILRGGVGVPATVLPATVLLGAVLLGVAACSGSTSFVPGSAPVRVTVAGGCPGDLGGHDDVANPRSGLTKHLVPAGDEPQAGLICRYSAGAGSAEPTPVLARSVPLSRSDATDLARALSAVSLRSPSGAVNCPAGVPGTVAVIVLRYAADDVDLWFADTGCQRIDNAHVQAFEVANPSFYDSFRSVFDRLAAQ